MDCKLNFFDPKAAKKAYGRRYTWMDRLIMLRSGLVHVEFVFSGRYGCISFSATLRDGCWCCRFKYINYSHPKQWRSVVIPFSDKEEDRAWAKACEMADLPIPWQTYRYNHFRAGGTYYGPNAVPYDIKGQICHVFKWQVVKRNPKKTWCSKACNELMLCKDMSWGEFFSADRLDLYLRKAEMMPEELFELCVEYFKVV